MRPSKIFAILILGFAGCPDWESLQTGLPNPGMSDLGMNPGNQDMPGSNVDMRPSDWTSVHTSAGPLNAISGITVPSELITVVGNGQTVVRGSGSSFTSMTIQGAGTNLLALWMGGQQEVWTSGTNGEVWRTTNGGSSWMNMNSGVSFILRAIYARNNSNQDIVAAGEDTDTGRHWDGTDWQDADIGRGDQTYGIWAGSSRVWAVCAGGDAATSTNPRSGPWNNVMDITGNPRLNAVSGLDDSNVWAVSDGGTLYRYESTNASWSSVTSVTGSLRAMWVRSATEVWVAGVSSNNGIVYRCDTVQRSCADQNSSVLNGFTVTGIWGNGTGGIWLTANNGATGVIFRR